MQRNADEFTLMSPICCPNTGFVSHFLRVTMMALLQSLQSDILVYHFSAYFVALDDEESTKRVKVLFRRLPPPVVGSDDPHDVHALALGPLRFGG